MRIRGDTHQFGQRRERIQNGLRALTGLLPTRPIRGRRDTGPPLQEHTDLGVQGTNSVDQLLGGQLHVSARIAHLGRDDIESPITLRHTLPLRAPDAATLPQLRGTRPERRCNARTSDRRVRAREVRMSSCSSNGTTGSGVIFHCPSVSSGAPARLCL